MIRITPVVNVMWYLYSVVEQYKPDAHLVVS